MEELTHILKECSINEIYNDGAIINYNIPIYQRNYAWEQDEINALIDDIYDSMNSDKPEYYIGTLVTFKHDDNIYEVIDGQQRLTTIFLILLAMGELPGNKLRYSSRKAATYAIKSLQDFVHNTATNNTSEADRKPLVFDDEYDAGIIRGYDISRCRLEELFGKNLNTIGRFKEYFLNKVKIIHYRVPKDIDLNHYFEVMNSRGEQLEMHEVVKAKLSAQFNDDPDAMKTFGLIWERCSDMSFYIQQKMPGQTAIFGPDMSSFVLRSFDDFPIDSDNASSSMGMKSINELLNSAVEKAESMSDNDKNDSFQPIIDFPNFLLIVLKITKMQTGETDMSTFVLDDKELINEFGKIELTPEFVKLFAYNLLRSKYYLDNYIVHHSTDIDRLSENPWKLQCYYLDKDKSQYPKNLIANDGLQEELVHLLSMFEVAFTAKQRKNYLFYCLAHLFQNHDTADYLTFVRKLADKYFFDVYLNAAQLSDTKQPKPNSFDNAIICNGKLNVELDGAQRNFDDIYPVGFNNIPLFVFNYTDYKLWKKYACELRGVSGANAQSAIRISFFDDLGCSDFGREVFNKFYFSRTRKSLEHYYPQAKAGEGKPLSREDINCFGNFAMISSEANSSGSDWNPLEKNNRYLDSKSNPISVASLKFRIMLQICQDNYEAGIKTGDKRTEGLEWNLSDIRRHQQKMLNIITKPILP